MTAREGVIDDYLVWEFCKQEGIKERIVEGPQGTEEAVEVILERVRQDFREKDYDLGEKMKQVREISSNPDHKVKMFEYCSWSKETVKIEDLGTTLPRTGDLPPEVISGSLQEVVEFVRESDPEEYRSVKFINRLKEVPDVLDEFLTTVISPGKLLRQRERMRKAHGDKNWDIQETWGAVHDGNHRTIAKILASDLEEIKCYVGRPASDKIYEHVEL